jgi:hypothetical protein
VNHLTEEQFEDVIKGSIPEPEHVSDCEQCRNVLAQKRALANRLRAAFTTIKPNKDLANNIRTKLISSAKVPEKTQHDKWFRIISFKTIAWPAAAAVLLIAIILGTYVINPPAAIGAPAELVKIHQHNLSDNHEFYSESDSEKLAEYFKDKLGFSPSMPALGRGMEIRGCCVRHFRGRIVGSYVVDTPRGVISVIVVTDEPHTLGMGKGFEYQGQTFYKSSFAKCDMVATRLGDFSYCAVGEITHECLTELLVQLIPKK